MLYSLLYVDWCHVIGNCISLDILLSNCLYLINWHYCSSGEGTDLSWLEHWLPEEITSVYRFEKRMFPWLIWIATLFEYQARRSRNQTVTSGQFWNVNALRFRQLCRKWDFTWDSNRTVRQSEIRRVWSEKGSIYKGSCTLSATLRSLVEGT